MLSTTFQRFFHTKMAYGSPADEERILTYAAPKEMSGATVAQSQSLPAPMGSSSQPMISSSAPSDPSSHTPQVTAISTDRFLSYAKQTWQETRPWNQFYSTRAIALPQFSALSDRFSTNLHIYRANYQVIAAFWLAFVLLGSIPSLLLAGGLFLLLERWCTWRANKNNSTLQKHEIFVAAVASLIIIWITDVGTFVVHSLIFSTLSISIHAALHEPEAVETEIATV